MYTLGISQFKIVFTSKVHKKNNPMRPICSAIGTSTYELGKFVANIIKPASFNNKFDTNLDNTYNSKVTKN